MAISINNLKFLLNIFEENGIIGAPQKEKEFLFVVQFPLFSPDAFLSKVVDQARDNKYIVFFTFLLKEHNISIQVKGHMRPEINVPMMHLCTVVSNVMSNAYEATLKLEDEEGKIIRVDIRSGSKFLYLM